MKFGPSGVPCPEREGLLIEWADYCDRPPMRGYGGRVGRLALRAPWFLFLVGMAAPAAALAAVVTVRGTTGDDVVSIQPQGPDRVLIQLNGEDVASAASGGHGPGEHWPGPRPHLR
jgi:hypothetical protein